MSAAATPPGRSAGPGETSDGLPGDHASAWLFVPAHEERKTAKALEALRDGRCQRVILDWEDAVPQDAKELARERTLGLLGQCTSQQRCGLVVRIHQVDSARFERDLEALAGWLIAAVMLPKAESAEGVRHCAALELPIIALIETALGVEQALEVARADSWVRGLALGPLDLLADVRAEWSAASQLIAAARTRLVFAARAAGLRQILLGPYPDLRDLDGLRRDTTLGRELGFTGRLLIHPAQIDPVREAFAPNESDLEFARAVISAWREQDAPGVLTVQGRFVDRPVVSWAHDLLERER